MAVYYLTIFSFLGLGMLYERWAIDNDSTKNNVLVILSLFLLILVYGFRYEVGEDWFSYINVYNRSVVDIWEFDTIELGYKYVNVFASLTTDAIWTVILICTTLFFIFTFVPLIKNNLNPYYFFAMVAPYHLVMSGVNFTRQAVALSIFLLAFSYILNGSKKKFSFFLVIASSFHVSAICFFPLYCVDWKKRYLGFAALSPLPLIYYLVTNDYEQYVNSEVENAGFLLRSLYLLAPAFFTWTYYMAAKYKENYFNVIETRLVYMSVLCFPLLIFVSLISTTMADRFSYYFILSSTFTWFFICKKVPYSLAFKVFSNVLIFLSSFLAFIVWCLFSSYAESYSFDSYLMYWF
ncbi:EpsG family protein [Vibrio alginolyticus]|uniref:EpsG family protein n=1 Tax=Vibrio chagasii TaxID=170679 RepID=UPI001EFE55E7|nr:EpsG family protein [Vibrio chagasii]MCG9606869.1 EpsG family protein [Vibrio chagasii]MDE9382884.1 EpsG family protein [Vibrio alginolyticus]